MAFLKYFVAGAVIPFVLIFAMALYIQPLVGDLTRLANVSERSWGWNAPQPILSIYPAELESNVQVVVIGDSFSEKDIWQSALRDLTGLKVKTYRWDDFGSPACIASGINNLKKRYSNIRFVVLETVERSSVSRIIAMQGDTDKCPAEVISSVHTAMSETMALRNKRLDKFPDVLYLFKAIIAEKKEYLHTVISSDGYISPLKRHDLFSNLKSDALLYYAGDLGKLAWTEDMIAHSLHNLGQLNQISTQSDVNVHTLIVPDKSTAYSKVLTESPFCGWDIDIWQKLDDASIPSINLKNLFIGQVTHIQDLYLPDDTHLGAGGYLLLASEIAKYINSDIKQSKK